LAGNGAAAIACAMSTPPTDLDLKGLKCPLPTLRTRKALRALAPGSAIRVVCTDPMAAIDIPNLVRETGDRLEDQRTEDDMLVFTIRRAEA
jgi:tRNA 2-thiouridine synthesizing protein A